MGKAGPKSIPESLLLELGKFRPADEMVRAFFQPLLAPPTQTVVRVPRIAADLISPVFPPPAIEPVANPPNPPDPPVRRLSGKESIPIAFERRRAELLAGIITEAGRKLTEESAAALDCAKLLSVGYCINELRKLPVVWSNKPRNSP